MANAFARILVPGAMLLTLVACGDDESPAPSPSPADLVLRNGYVYTVDGQSTVAEAVAIDDGVIVFVGSDEDAQAYIGEGTEERDLDGQMLLPGLHDMHIHAFGIIESDGCDLGSEELSLPAMVPVLKDCLTRFDLAPGDWLVVQQWSFSGGNEPGAGLPNIRAALDAVSTEHPIFLYGDDGHHGAANSLALAKAISDDGTPVPINAETLAEIYADYGPLIEVDALGEPTGGIHEGARSLLRPDWITDMMGISGDLDAKVERIADVLARNGITTIQDAALPPRVLDTFGRRELRGAMTFRLRAALVEPEHARMDAIAPHLESLIALRERYADFRYVHADAVKLFADAVLEGNPLSDPPVLPVAAVLENFRQPIFAGSIEEGSFALVGYVDQDSDVCRDVQANPDAYGDSADMEGFRNEFGYYPQQCVPASGVLENDEDYLRAYIAAATEAGFHVHVHALSDKAVRITVDEFAKARPVAERLGVSQSIAHLQLVHPDDQKRMGELGIAGVFTLSWTEPSLQYEAMVRPFIDEVGGLGDMYNPNGYYMENVYPARSLQEFGAPIVHGSDAPVDTRDPRPFVNLMQALYRSDGEVVMNADERLDIASAIEAFTINGARLFGHEDRLGSIEVGKIADLVAIDRNIVELAAGDAFESIAETRVTLTLFEGRVIHELGASESASL